MEVIWWDKIDFPTWPKYDITAWNLTRAEYFLQPTVFAAYLMLRWIPVAVWMLITILLLELVCGMDFQDTSPFLVSLQTQCMDFMQGTRKLLWIHLSGAWSLNFYALSGFTRGGRTQCFRSGGTFHLCKLKHTRCGNSGAINFNSNISWLLQSQVWVAQCMLSSAAILHQVWSDAETQLLDLVWLAHQLATWRVGLWHLLWLLLCNLSLIFAQLCWLCLSWSFLAHLKKKTCSHCRTAQFCVHYQLQIFISALSQWQIQDKREFLSLKVKCVWVGKSA